MTSFLELIAGLDKKNDLQPSASWKIIPIDPTGPQSTPHDWPTSYPKTTITARLDTYINIYNDTI